MTLALELARHGVPSRMFERAFTTTRHPKMDITNGRSMELFRRLGLANKLRAAGVPDTHPLDVAWVTSMVGHELHRFKYAPPAKLRARYSAINDGAQPLEPAMRVSQIVVEPILQAAVLAEPLIDARWGMAVEGAGQSDAGVWVDVRDCESDQVQRIEGAYLAGCDGGNSTVRAGMEIALEGDSGVANRYMIHFKSDDRAMLQRFGIAWHYQSPAGTLIAQNDVDTWTLHARFPDAVDPDSVVPMDALRAFLGADINAEILVANPWEPHLLLADAYQKGRVFLAGDAAHQYIPTGGYGMNTGIGDAVALGWTLAATMNGWGGPGLLTAYEAERRPIGGINRGWSGRHTGVRIAIMEAYQAHPNAAGDAAERAKLASAIAVLGNLENEAWGVEFAYRYDASPLIAPMLVEEGGPPPLDDPAVIPAAAWPGMRAPSFILPDDRVLFDLFDPSGFTLLRFNPGIDTSTMQQTGVPVTQIDVVLDTARDVYGADLALIRPDGHLAWRGNAPSVWAVKVAAGAVVGSSSPGA